MRTLTEMLRPQALTVRALGVRRPLITSLMRPVSVELERRRRLVGTLLPPGYPDYSAVDGGRVATPEEGWRLLVDHLHRPQHFDSAPGDARAEGHSTFVALEPAGTLERAARSLGGDEVAVAARSGAARRGRGAKGWT
jgi:hypothetical protein